MKHCDNIVINLKILYKKHHNNYNDKIDGYANKTNEEASSEDNFSGTFRKEVKF